MFYFAIFCFFFSLTQPNFANTAAKRKGVGALTIIKLIAFQKKKKKKSNKNTVKYLHTNGVSFFFLLTTRETFIRSMHPRPKHHCVFLRTIENNRHVCSLQREKVDLKYNSPARDSPWYMTGVPGGPKKKKKKTFIR